MLVAGAQTGGRGQRGNSWQSGAGEGLFATLFLQPEHLSIGRLPLVVKASALAVVDVLEQLPGHALNPQIKWPNDILVQGRKIAGVLVESSIRGDAVQELFLGFGINLNQASFPTEFSTPAVSVHLLLGSFINAAEIAVTVRDAALVRFAQVEKDESVAELEADYQKRLFGVGKSCVFQSSDRLLTGELLCIDDEGRAVVNTQNGRCILNHPEYRLVNVQD